MATETMNVKSIEVVVDNSSLFSGWSSEDVESVDVSASIDKYLDAVANEIMRYWPEATVSVSDGGTMLRDEVTVRTTIGDVEGLTLQEDTAEAIRQAMSDIYMDGNKWQVDRDDA